MISYRDMTFCPYWKDCKSAHMCHRPLTAQVQAAARKSGLAVSMFMGKPECWSPKRPEVTTNEPPEALTCH